MEFALQFQKSTAKNYDLNRVLFDAETQHREEVAAN